MAVTFIDACVFIWTFAFNIGQIAAATTPSVGSTNLTCYDCQESFKYVWEPYTECQSFPPRAPLRECMASERYCKVERVTYQKMTVSITRGCTQECWHGCSPSGFGYTKLKCTSCCNTPECNVGDTATSGRGSDALVIFSAILASIGASSCLPQL